MRVGRHNSWASPTLTCLASSVSEKDRESSDSERESQVVRISAAPSGTRRTVLRLDADPAMTIDPHSQQPAAPLTGSGFLRSLVADPQYGRLPALLIVLTVVTGLVDAVSILRLGRVFVANMTGNVVFVGFAAVGAPGFSLVASVVALAGFLIGASAGGRLIRGDGGASRFLAAAALSEFVLVVATTGIAAGTDFPAPLATISAMAGLLALAMGLQNAMARKLAVPDLTTTVLTMALTGVAADPRLRPDRPRGRRVASVLAMFAGAVVGATLVIHAQVTASLGIAAGLLLVVGLVANQTEGSGGGGCDD